MSKARTLLSSARFLGTINIFFTALDTPGLKPLLQVANSHFSQYLSI